MPLLGCLNLIILFGKIKDINYLTREHENLHQEKTSDHAKSLYIDKLYKDYRSVMMNFCSVLLII
jgi:hypothetical protein